MSLAVERVELQGNLWPWSSLIMLSTWSKWSHAVLILSDGSILDASPFKGVTNHKRDKYTNDDGSSIFNFWWTKSYDMTKKFSLEQREAMYARAITQLGSDYDWEWIAGYPFNRNWEDEDDWVCFEFVAWTLSPWVEVPKELHRITGRHLHKALERLRISSFIKRHL